jgi:YesN/AraC family two-component response regulator
MTIAIVEDEKPERESIKLLLGRIANPPEIIFETFNGEDAVRLFEEYRPQVLLVDMNLPGLSGIELIKRVRTMDTEVEVVIISAYSDFVSAREAIQLRVFDYLLKPCSKEKLYHVINRIESKVSEKHRRDENRISSRLFLEIDEYMKKELFCYLTSAKIFDEWTVGFMEDFFKVKERRLCCVFVYSGECADDAVLGRLKGRIENRLKPLICRITGRDILILVQENPGDHEGGKIARVIESCLKPEQGIGCIQGSWTNSLGPLLQSFKDLAEKQAAMKERRDYKSHGKNVLDLYDIETALFKSVVKCRWADVERYLIQCDALRKEIDQGSANIVKNRAYYCYLWRQVDRYIFQVTGKRKTIDDKSTIDMMIEKAETTEELTKIIFSFLVKYVESFDFDNADYSEKIIEKVKEYISANIKEDLSLERVAEVAGFSSFYLSKLFKKQEKDNFKDYVIKIRMEKAKQLLSCKNLSIKQAAYAVGYPDANYFSRAFKKYTGFPAKNYLDKQ